MRRSSGGAALGVLLTALLVGCGTPTDTDGDLIDDWGAVPAAQPFVPKAGACHLVREPTSYLTSYLPVDCAKAHKAETVHVGTFTGPDADRPTPPGPNSTGLHSAFAECDTQATRFVGADWRGGRLSVEPVLPSPANWAAGGRWYRCDLFVLDALDGGSARNNPDDFAVDQTGSLRDALKQPSPLRHDCFNENEWEDLQPVACDRKHRFEYVGVWTAPFASYDEFDGSPQRTHHRCGLLVAEFVKAPDHRLGTTFRAPSEAAWARGDRGIRCFLWSDARDLTRSVKGVGPTGLPGR